MGQFLGREGDVRPQVYLITMNRFSAIASGAGPLKNSPLHDYPQSL
jgi:hypothetical protein